MFKLKHLALLVLFLQYPISATSNCELDVSLVLERVGESIYNFIKIEAMHRPTQ